MFNDATGKVIQTRDVKWAEWHGKSTPTDDLTIFNTTTFGIDDIQDEDDERNYNLPKVNIHDNKQMLETVDKQISEAGRKDSDDTSKSATTNKQANSTTRLD